MWCYNINEEGVGEIVVAVVEVDVEPMQRITFHSFDLNSQVLYRIVNRRDVNA